MPRYFLAKQTHTDIYRQSLYKEHIIAYCVLAQACLHLLPRSFPVQSILKWEGTHKIKSRLKNLRVYRVISWTWGTDSQLICRNFFHKSLKTIILLDLLKICTDYSVVFQYSCLALIDNLVCSSSVLFFRNHRRYPHYLCQTVATSTERRSSMSNEVKPESVPLCPLGTEAAPELELLCIFGTGDLGRSLGQRLLQTGYRVVYGSRRPHSCGPLPEGAQV